MPPTGPRQSRARGSWASYPKPLSIPRITPVNNPTLSRSADAGSCTARYSVSRCDRSPIMKKVTAFVGSAHKKNTYKAVVQFLNNLQALGDVETEIVTLSDYKLGFCRGCRLCFEKGEEYCPLKDDRDVLFEKLTASDGVIFATPNYTFQMTGMMKAFIDRLGFACHRPRFFGKVFTSIVTQGFGGGSDIVK